MFRTYKYNNYNNDNGVKKEIRIHIQKSIQLSMERIFIKKGVKEGVVGFGLTNKNYCIPE